MDRSALLVVLAAAAATLAFAVGAAAFTPTIDGSGGTIADRSESSGPERADPSGQRASSGSPQNVAETDDCRLCSGLDVRSAVLSALPSVDPRVLLVVLALAVVGLAYTGLRAVEGDATAEMDALESDRDRRTGARSAPASEFDLHAPPSNDVYRAWRSMADRIDVPQPAATTPREYARAATDAGLPDDAVQRLTDLFEHTRYGGAAVTDDRERQARDAADRIGAQEESPERGDP